MAKMSSVEFLRKVSRHGIMQPMYDRFRVGEIADELEECIGANADLKLALKLALQFIQDHFGESNVTGPDAAVLLAAVASATAPKSPPIPFDRPQIASGGEFVLAYDPATGRADTESPVVVGRNEEGHVKALYHPAPAFDLEDEVKQASNEAGFDLTKIVEADDAQPDAVQPEGDAERRD